MRNRVLIFSPWHLLVGINVLLGISGETITNAFFGKGFGFLEWNQGRAICYLELDSEKHS